MSTQPVTYAERAEVKEELPVPSLPLEEGNGFKLLLRKFKSFPVAQYQVNGNETSDQRKTKLYDALKNYKNTGDRGDLDAILAEAGISKGDIDVDVLSQAVFGPKGVTWSEKDSQREFKNFVSTLHSYAYYGVGYGSNYHSAMTGYGIKDYTSNWKAGTDKSPTADGFLDYLKIDTTATPPLMEWGDPHELPDTTKDNKDEWDGFTYLLNSDGESVPAVFDDNGNLIPAPGYVKKDGRWVKE